MRVPDAPTPTMAAARGLPLGERYYFHWRGEGVTRVENLSDAVFAFALTLLVVSTEVPRSFEALLVVLRGFPAFALSFMLLLAIWYNHYLYFRRYGLHDTTTVALNNLLLLVVLFCVYPLKFVSLVTAAMFGPMLSPDGEALHHLNFWQFALLLRVYAAALGSIFLVFTLLYGRAWKFRDALQLTRAERLATLRMITGFSLTICVCLLSALLTFHPRTMAASGLLYLLLIPMLIINASVFRRRIRRSISDD